MRKRSQSANLEQPSHCSILECGYVEARKVLLQHDSYCKLDMPPYIRFDSLLYSVDKVLGEGNISSKSSDSPNEYAGVNYSIYHNKDGKYAWRLFELIHPELYVTLVHKITSEENWTKILACFKEFSLNEKISCLSMPVVSLSEQKDHAEQVKSWWLGIEQKSIELSLEYEYLLVTDIADCYPSIYTHSIAWALHTRDVAKSRRKNGDLLGNSIDQLIRKMRKGQTNGIPQGSATIDLIAELVLGFADTELTKKLEMLKIEDYKILRYRDDYRIFVNNPEIGEQILKALSEVMIELGLKLNPNKTEACSQVIRNSIKADKLAWISQKQFERNLQKYLLLIQEYSYRFPNSGSLVIALNSFHKRVRSRRRLPIAPTPLIAIVVEIASRSPRTYPISMAIISCLLSFIDSDQEKLALVQKIIHRFGKMSNIGHLEIWLQRMTIKIAPKIDYNEKLCKIVTAKVTQANNAQTDILLWNSQWIKNKDLKHIIDEQDFVDLEALEKLDSVIKSGEVELFTSWFYD